MVSILRLVRSRRRKVGRALSTHNARTVIDPRRRSDCGLDLQPLDLQRGL